MYEGEKERSATARHIRAVNTIRALSYFLVAGVQTAYCITEAPVCSAMIVLVPLSLGLMDSLLIWQSSRDTLGVKIFALSLCIISLIVAINTLVPILQSGALTPHTQFMLILSLVVIIISIAEFIITANDLATTKEESDSIMFSTSIRTYQSSHVFPY